MLFDLLGQVKAVHLWHHGIEKRQRERLAGAGGFLHRRERRPATGYHRRLHAPVGQHLCEDAAVRGIIVNHQYGQVLHVHSLGQRLRRRPCLQAEACREVEGASCADFALDPDPAAHQGDELRRNCQPQSRAAKLARRGTVGLREGVEDHVLLFGGNPDAGVTHREMQDTRVQGSWFKVQSLRA